MQVASVFAAPWITRGCRLIQDNRTWKALGVEFIGINLPRSLIVRSWDEALDAGVNEFGNTIGFFGGLWGLSALTDKLMKRMRIPLNPNPAILNQGRAMKSAALVFPLVSFMVAMPFLRNAFTAWRCGSVAFKSVITAKPGQKPPPVNRQETRLFIRRALQTALAILGLGIGLGIAGFLLAANKTPFRIFQRPDRLVKSLDKGWLRKGFRHACLPGSKATSFEDLWAVFYWGVPAYLSWMAASRDLYEVKEWALKMASFVSVYLFTDKCVNLFLSKKTATYARKYPQAYAGPGKAVQFSYARCQEAIAKAARPLKKSLKTALAFENAKLIGGLALTVVMMVIAPLFLNIHLTAKRLARAETMTRRQARQSTTIPPPPHWSVPAQQRRLDYLPPIRYA